MSPILKDIPDMTFKYMDGGRYQLIKRLGAGSYGVVYRARERDLLSGHYVPRAIKVLSLHWGHRNSHLREITMHSMVTGHDNVVGLHRAFREGNFLYIVMDLLDGGDLRTHISKKRTLCRNDALIRNVFLQIIDGVQACHDVGVYHRDLKPENIFVNSDLTRVCIGDFGLSTDATASTSFNTGSRHYMSPECVDCGDELYPYNTLRSDTWALGILLLTIVTGYIPWNKATIDDKNFRAFLEQEDHLLTVFPISKELNGILRRIFTIIPGEALTLPELRREIRNLDTFYMTEANRDAAPLEVQFMWQWYSPRISSADSLDSTDSEGGWDSWTESESSDSYDDDSGDSAEGDAPKHTQSLQLPAQALGRKGASEPIRRPSARTLSSDEFPIRRPATRRAQLPPVPSSPTTSSSDETPVTPEAHAQDPGPTIVSSGTIEPLVLEGPVLCHGKASDRGNKSVGVRTLSEMVRNLVSSQRT